MKEGNERVDWIDIARGFAIILVYLGHQLDIVNGDVSKYVRIFIYAFHIPLFFFLAGYNFKNKYIYDYKKFIINKFKRLLIPLWIFSIIQILVNFFYYKLCIGIYDYNSFKSWILGLLVQQRMGRYNTLLWFIGTLFIAENLLFIVKKIEYRLKNKALVMFMVIICYCVGTMLMHDKKSYPWNIDAALVSILFMQCGCIYREKENIIKNVKHKYFKFIFVCVGIIGPYINYWFCGIETDIFKKQVDNVVLFPIVAVINCLIIIEISKKIKSKIITYIGKNSLQFYALDRIAVIVPNILLFNVYNIDYNKVGTRELIFILFLLLIQLTIAFIFTKMINKYCKWMIGDFKKK